MLANSGVHQSLRQPGTPPIPSFLSGPTQKLVGPGREAWAEGRVKRRRRPEATPAEHGAGESSAAYREQPRRWQHQGPAKRAGGGPRAQGSAQVN